MQKNLHTFFFLIKLGLLLYSQIGAEIFASEILSASSLLYRGNGKVKSTNLAYF